MARFVNPVDLKRNTTNRKLIVIFFGLTGLLSLFFWLKGRDKTSSLLQPYKVSYKIETKQVDTPYDTSRPTTELITTLQATILGAKGEYSWYVHRLSDGKGYGSNENTMMPAASIMKVPIMVATYREIEASRLQETAEIQQLLTAMGKRSDNAAPVVLIDKLGRPKMRSAVLALGMKNTDFDANTTTAHDVAEMWRRIYQDEIISAAHRDKMWSDLQDSIFEDRIPAGVPEEINVVHKVGTDINIWADAGIVLAEDPFILVILNKDVSLAEAKILLPKVTELVWDYEASASAQQQP